MRKIKFRAWNKKIGWKNQDGTPCKPSMEYDGFVIFPESGLCNLPEGGWDLSFSNENPENLILMQYMGLKDKNNKEIFEGDIVKHKDVVYIIDFNKRSAAFQFVHKHHSGQIFAEFIHDITGDVEVIGNIYENSELLKNDPK